MNQLLRRLHLANTRQIRKDLEGRAEKEQWSYRDFLAVLVAEEVAHRHPPVLVIDEVGYLAYGSHVVKVLFHVVNEPHQRKKSMVFTTNKSLAEWGRVAAVGIEASAWNSAWIRSASVMITSWTGILHSPQSPPNLIP